MLPRFQHFRTRSQGQAQREEFRADRNGVSWATLPHVRATMSVDGAVLLDIEKGLCYSLNVVGAKIWQVIESGAGRTKFKDVVNALATQFNVSAEELGKDVDEYMRDLQQRELIKATNRP